jgi:hypothetical protein
MGFDWVRFRIKYLFMQKSNHFDRVNSKIIAKVSQLEPSALTMPKLNWIDKKFQGDTTLLEKADHAMEGNFFAFSHEYFDYKKEHKINWQINPVTKAEANSQLSWNNLPDFGEYGDIKLIWEASRFPQIYFFINAYSVTSDKKYAYACIEQIVDWIDNNPYPKGVNYKCGQEITFRIIAWMVALDYFSDFLKEDDEQKIVKNIYISLLRVDANIDYAARAVKNNHSISESIGLILFGLYFKQFNESEKLLKKGLKYLKKETDYQVYSDGSYIQHSFTYQRLTLDILSFIILVSKRANFQFPSEIVERQKKMIKFLNSFIQENGWLPNYGTNDGANLFPIAANDYRDFRVNLNFASAVSLENQLFLEQNSLSKLFKLKQRGDAFMEREESFLDGGYYIVKNQDIFSFIRCHSYKDRPAQNDMLHLDIWYKDENIFCDAGSFSYNTDKEFKNNFNGTVGHNTIMINNDNQMQQVLNFGWSNWTKSKLLESSSNFFNGEHYGYKEKYGVTCNRQITLNENIVVVVDTISKMKNKVNIKQLWNTKEKVTIIDDYTIKVKNCIVTSNYPIKLEKSYISDYYNSYSEGTKLVVEIDSNSNVKIKTIMEFK